MIAKILASVGLPNTKAGREKFYKLFDTEEKYHMAMGGTPNYAFAGTTGPGDDNIPVVKNIPKGYIKSTTKPGLWERTTTEPGSTIPVTPTNIPAVPLDKRTKDPNQYANDMTELVKSGKRTVEDLVGTGAITKEFAKTLAPYSKTDYLRLEEPVIKTVPSGIPLKDSDRIDRKQIWTSGNQNQFYDTFQYPDVNAGYSQATTRYFDKKTGQEVDPGKSFDAKGNYIASFMQGDPNTVAGTLKQTRLNTEIGSATDNAVTNAYSGGLEFGGVPNFFNPQYFMNKGGMPCFNCGGMKEEGGAFVDDGTVPMMNFGGMENYMQEGGAPTLSKNDYVNMFKSLSKKPSKSSTIQGETDEAYLDKRNKGFKESIQNYFMEHVNKELAEEAYNADQQMMNSQYAQYGQTTNQFGRMANPASNMFKAQYEGMQDQANQNYGQFMGATNQMFDNADPYMKTSIKPMAAEGIQVSTNPTTGKPWSPEEWAAIQKLNEGNKKQTSTGDKTGDKWYNQGYGSHGMDYFPMNYNPFMKMSKEDIANWQMLENNPTTNLKEFRTRHFGPWGSTKMVFGAKDKLQPFTPTGQVELGPNYSNEELMNTVNQFKDKGNLTDKFSVAPKEKKTPIKINDGKPTSFYDFESLNKAYGGDIYLPKHEVPPGQVTTQPYGMWGFQGAANPNVEAEVLKYKAFGTPDNNLANPNSYTTTQGKTDADIAGTAPAPVSGDPLTNYDGDEKLYEINQKYRPGFQGEDVANWTIAGMAGTTSFLNSREVAKNKQKYLNEMSLADNQHYSQEGHRGTEQDQWGMRSPDQHVYSKNPGYNTGNIQQGVYGVSKFGGAHNYFADGGFAEGGEYYLSDDEIEMIMKMGGNVEFLD